MEDADRHLLDAVTRADVEEVRRAISNGANPNLLVEGDVPILVQAAASGNTSLTKALLESGSDPNFRATFRITPLMLLAIGVQGDIQLPIIRLLLDAGADPTAKDQDGMNAASYFNRFGSNRSREIGALLASGKETRHR